jgi:hypothetical protein
VHRAEELRATNSAATPRPEVTPMEHSAETNFASP